MWNDWKHALRSLLGNRMMALTAIAALCLGIGANTALFTVVNAVLLKPLKYPNPDRIVRIVRDLGTVQSGPVTPFQLDFWRTQNHSFEAVAAYNFGTLGLNLTGRGDPQRLTALPVTADFFRVLGVRPWIGRDFQAADDRPGVGRTAILSYGLWRRVFKGDRNVIGRGITLSEATYTVIGVMPQGFDFPVAAEIFAPLQLQIDPADRAHDYMVLGRLKPAVSLEQAKQDMRLVAISFRRQFKDTDAMVNNREGIRVQTLQSRLVGDIRPALLVLMSAVGFVLMIACANVAHLLLARSLSRARELAVRVALGASHWRIVRLLLAESLTLALVGGAAGVLLAQYSLPLLLRLTPADLPAAGAIAMDWTVILFALATATVTGIVFGLFPAFQVIRSGVIDPIKESAARTTGGAASTRAREVLVVAEVALSLVLLAGAGLLVQTFRNLVGVNPGFRTENVLVTRMSLTSDRFQKTVPTAQLVEEVQRRLEALPGVQAAGTISNLPTEPGFDDPFEIPGRKTKDFYDENFRVVSPHYFDAMRIPVISGRSFTERDTRASQLVIIVNEAFARKYFPRESALGKQMLVARIMGPDFADGARTIIGIVGDTHDAGLGEPTIPIYFEPVAQLPDRLMSLANRLVPITWVIKTAGGPMGMAEVIRREALRVTGQIPMSEPVPLEQVIGNSIARERFLMTLLLGFAGLATLLSGVGLYGVISYSVAQRTREFGIRAALGADRGSLLNLVLRRGMVMVGLGIAAGALSGLALNRLLQGMLFQVSASDPAVMLGAAVLLALVALSAMLAPALRAARLDPVSALREG